MAAAPLPEELSRAARVLWVRSRRAASRLAAGGYASAFRGVGMEFDESRPYEPGDDVRHFDWNAMARTGEPFVKRFREERDQTLVLLLDVSASMAFTSGSRTKAELAAHTAALLAVAAGHAGDRVGLVAFGEEVVCEMRARRGEAHIWQLVRSVVDCAHRPAGGTRLATALARVPRLASHRAIVVVLSDFRDGSLAGPTIQGGPRARLVAAARHHDLVAAIVQDPRDEELPDCGVLRLADPEARGGELVIDSGSKRARALYRTACGVRRRALERRLRGDGADVLWLRTDRDPLPRLVRFFHAHAGRVHGGVG
ncbi:MAG: DUF58 domain-containing protein [Myxococcota bacterium]